MFINVTAVHSQCTREIVMSRCARCAAYSCHWIEYHHTCWWVHQSTGADPISSSVHDLFATEDKIKPLEIILIMRKIRTIKWWAYITAKRWRWETTKKGVVFSTLFNFVTFFSLSSSSSTFLCGCYTQTKWTFQRIFHLHHIHLRWFNCSFCSSYPLFNIMSDAPKGCDHLEKLTFWTFFQAFSKAMNVWNTWLLNQLQLFHTFLLLCLSSWNPFQCKVSKSLLSAPLFI